MFKTIATSKRAVSLAIGMFLIEALGWWFVA